MQGKEKRVVEVTHPALVDAKTFDRIQSELQRRAFKLTDAENTPSTPNILKGKVICGCCGSKMQRRRRTNHASWYFFTCLTNNRVGSDCCTGMYVREEDIFSAIYYQLKLFVKANIDFSVGYQDKKAALEQEIAELQEMLSDPMECTGKLYERFIFKEIDKDTYFVERAKVYAAKEHLEDTTQALNAHEQQYQRLKTMQKVINKELPLNEIVDFIGRILISEGRRIEVKWRENC